MAATHLGPECCLCAAHSLLHAVVEVLGGPETDDGVDNRGRVDWGAAVDDGDENGILFAVVATGRWRSYDQNRSKYTHSLW